MLILSLFYFFFYIIFGINALQCAYYKSRLFTHDSQDSLIEKGVETCRDEANSFCFAVWSHHLGDPFDASLYQLIGRGCWNNTGDSYCDNSQCISQVPLDRAINNTSFCCCTGNLCNLNLTFNLADSFEYDSVNNVIDEDYSDYKNFVVVATVFFFISTVILAVCCRAFCSRSTMIDNSKSLDSLHLLEAQSLHSRGAHKLMSIYNNQNDLVNLTFEQIVGEGTYGTVWRGSLEEMPVAIKVLPETNKRFLMNEARIYSMPLMDHPNLPRFYGYTEKIGENGSKEYCLAIEYAHYSSLQNYLREHIFDWAKLCQLIRSLVQGLAYLHSEIGQQNQVKPSIAHRDLCSKNILVKSDGTCMICDFKFAVPFVENFSPVFEDCSLVGTVRYFAPEVLDGAINLRHCESSLKQADIYSLGLVLWEIATRCSDLYQGIDVPVFKLPFEQEVGLLPTFDQMRALVNHNKARPLFPDIWKDSNCAIRLLKETIVECWDHEPEARLTALCVEKRLSELPLLWRRYKKEIPSSCCVMSMKQTSNESTRFPLKADLYVDLVPGKFYINKFENSLHYKHSNYNHLLHHPHHSHYFYANKSNSERKHDLNSTIEKNHYAATKWNQSKLTLPLQPHQARNPCIERNLMLDGSDEYEAFLEQGIKFQNKNYHKSSNIEDLSYEMQPQENTQLHSEIAGDSRSLLQRSPTQPMPIPYVQNPVGSHSSYIDLHTHSARAKDVNKYRNGASSTFIKFKLVELLKQFDLSRFSGINRKVSHDNYKRCLKVSDTKETIQSLLYSRNKSGDGREYSPHSTDVASLSPEHSSSPVISTNCDLTYYSTTKDYRMQSVMENKENIGLVVGDQKRKLNNQINSLSLLLPDTGKTQLSDSYRDKDDYYGRVMKHLPHQVMSQESKSI